MKTHCLTVRLTLPDGVTKADAIEYVKEAVTGYGGSRHPLDPFFGIKDDDVKVTPSRTKRTPPELPPATTTV